MWAARPDWTFLRKETQNKNNMAFDVQTAVAIHLDKNFSACYEIRILITPVENGRQNIENIHRKTTDKILRKFYMRGPNNDETIPSEASDKMLMQFTARLSAKYLYRGSPQKYRHNWP